MNQKYPHPDQILLLINILNIKSEYDVIFKLLAPKSYVRLWYLFFEFYEGWVGLNDIPELNARKILSQILWSVFHEEYHVEENGQVVEDYAFQSFSYIDAKMRCKNQFQFPINNQMNLTNLSECSDNFELGTELDDVKFCMNTQQLMEYIDTLPPSKTKNLTFEKFENMIGVLDVFFKDLEKELSVFEI